MIDLHSPQLGCATRRLSNGPGRVCFAWRATLAACLTASGLGAAGCGPSSTASATVTFNKDIAPIVFANCAPCHRPAGAGPFPLLTYADVAKRADTIAELTRERHMPPWLPEAGEFKILGERRLSDEQIDAIQRWVKDGTLEGRAADLPAPPAWTGEWELGGPDEVVTAVQPYILGPGTEDVYRNLVLRRSATSSVFVRAVEFKTGGAPVHHAVIRIDQTSGSRRRDAADGQPGFDGMSWETVQDPDGHFIGWAPGRGPIVAPEGIPWRLDRGADLVVEVHLIPSDEPVPVQPTVGLYFTDAPPLHTPVTVRMGSKLIDIPAGQRDYLVTDVYELPVPVDLMSVYPHAHYLGKEMLVTATLPDGTVRTVMHIPQWSFDWQQDYRFVTPIPLPRGTKLTMRYTYDNSEANPDNPHRPPVRVQTGPKSTDEMAELGLQVMPMSPEDADVLLRSFDERAKLANVAMAEKRVREEPDVAEYRALLGGSYVEAGRFADAVPHLEAAVRLGERSGSTYNYLGVALMEEGRVRAALTEFQRAEAADPRDERIAFNRAIALSKLSRFTEAAAAYRRSLDVNPDFLDAHVNLAVLLFSLGRTNDALPHYQRAVELRPDSALIHNNYGGALAAAGRYAEAMQHVQRALALDPTYGPAVDNLRRLERLVIK
ncbi:MAG TPA: tetratricopeptide repeat protein [Vicinamibacterales bacterium]|nr:tetratricopeptide repeat protein [Vicinamibacterales bacterium]